MYIYHYCAQKQELNNSIIYTDGIAELSGPILAYNDYIELKKKIDSKNANRLTIISLTLLHERK